MISKPTRQIIFNFFHRASYPKFPTHSLLTPSKSLPFIFPINSVYSLHNVSRNSFSNSANSNNDSDKSPKPNKKEPKDNSKPKSQATKRKVVRDQEEAAKIETMAASSEEKTKSSILASVPLRPMKLPVEKDEEELKPETYLLYSSNLPVIPHSMQPGAIGIDNIPIEYRAKKKAFFTTNDQGEIYTVGVILKEEVNRNPVREIKPLKNRSQGRGQPSVFNKEHSDTIITTPAKNYKVKLVEIEMKNGVILAKAIPYSDSKLNQAEKDINVKLVLGQIANLTMSIRQSVLHDKIEVFGGMVFDWLHASNTQPERIDEALSSLVAECGKLYVYFKESFTTFVQVFLEEKNPILRMFIVKKKLQEIRTVLDIVSKSTQHADEQIWRFQEQAKARISLEFIKANFLSGESVPPIGGKAGKQTGDPMLSEQARKFMEKLHLIEDEISKERVRKEIEKLGMQDKMSGEYHKLYAYLDDVFSIPWGKYSEEYWDINYSKQVLDKKLFGLDKVKERIIEMVAVNKLHSTLEESKMKKKGFVILINGPPGTGKTTVAKSIAEALKRESRFISFAGVTDPAFVKGHKRTYLDAQPGVFVRELIKSKVMNPVFILDEMDKLSKNFHGADPYYALMEILNPEENHNFTDHYLDIKVDFSEVIFILTSNQVLNMLEPLRNRLEIIEVPAYIEQEKLKIAKNYLLPAILTDHQLPVDNITFDDQTILKIIKGWCYYESGVRNLGRCFEKIARKHALDIINTYQKSQSPPPETEEKTSEPANATTVNVANEGQDKSSPVSQGIEFGEKGQQSKEAGQTDVKEEEKPARNNNAIPLGSFDAKEASQLIELKNQMKLVFNTNNDPDDEILKKYLGNPEFDDMYERRHRQPFYGTANVLTVAGFTGHVLTVECIYDLSSQTKKGVLTSSGNIEKVLQESLTIARLVAFKFLPEDKVQGLIEKNVHIHFLQGGVPKDGPSAGVSICAAFLSLMLNKHIPQNISMTGELSLHGDVCKVGGIQAKVTASKVLDINTIVLPWGNKSEFYELPQLLKDGLTVYFVKDFQEVYNILFENTPENLRSIERYADGKFIEPVIPVTIPTNAYLNVKNS